MFISPKKFKYKKAQKRRPLNSISSHLIYSTFLEKGVIGLKALSNSWFTSKQIIAFYSSVSKIMKKRGRVRMKVFPRIPISRKPIEVRMGKGKGAVSYHAYKVKPGSLICELETNLEGIAIKALTVAQKKLPFKTKIIR